MTEIKINVLRIKERERSREIGFIKRIKEGWDMIYDLPMSAQCFERTGSEDAEEWKERRRAKKCDYDLKRI